VGGHAHVASNGSQVNPSLDGPTGRRILVVDDHEIVRTGLRSVLSRQEWVSRCVGAGDVAIAKELARRYEPHIALIDVVLGTDSGIDLCRALVSENRRPPGDPDVGRGSRVTRGCAGSGSARLLPLGLAFRRDRDRRPAG